MAREKSTIGNFSDDELILTKYKLRCQSLKAQNMEMLKIRENFRIQNLEHDHISKSLLKLKMEYELHREDLCKTLFNLKLASDKQQIISKRKINEFVKKRENLEEYLSMSPLKIKLEELVSQNNNLQDQWDKVSFLLNLTKNQYKEIMSFLLKNFKMKVCEFCDTVLKLKASTH